MRALDDMEQDSPPFTPAALVAFEARGFARVPLAEAKAALVGVSLICAQVDDRGPAYANAYEVVSVTREAVILAYRRPPTRDGEPGSLSKTFSIVIATGRTRPKAYESSHTALHPKQADLLRGLLGVALPTPKAPK